MMLFKRVLLVSISIALALYIVVGISVITKIGGLKSQGAYVKPCAYSDPIQGGINCSHPAIAIFPAAFYDYPEMYSSYTSKNDSYFLSYVPVDIAFAVLGLITTAVLYKKVKK